MRLLEAIIDANHRAAAGDPQAGLRPGDFASSLPLVALTCIDPRLNPLIPEVLGVPEEQFIWLRNAGNIITGALSSTMRSLALACAIKQGREICIIGHTDCQVGRATAMLIIDRLKELGVERHLLPDNLLEYFGLFSSERQNVLRGVETVRKSPLIGSKVPVHGLLVDIQTGTVEWLVNGYHAIETAPTPWRDLAQSAGQTLDALKALPDLKIGDFTIPTSKIGDAVATASEWAKEAAEKLPGVPTASPSEPAAVPPRIPLPPPFRPKLTFKRKP